ncbi:isochorismatase family protein [Streptomyces griseoluteus]|uniref:isochorismatase family protein n=1 Tax=Streptomyces griseoluteus TaxID=29306 RepID=UPI00369C9353
MAADAGVRRPGRPVLDAETFGKWTPEPAARPAPGSRLVPAGVSTESCVPATALAAADAGVEVVVVADACVCVDDEAHAKALHVLDLYWPLARVTAVHQPQGEDGP